MSSTLPVRTPNPTHARAYLAWGFVCLVWGTTYLAIRIALETMPPLLMGGIRYLASGLLMIPILAARGETLPRVREWPALMVLGALMLGLGNGGVVWAEQTVPSGLTAVLVATSPFWMVGIDALTPHGERLTMRRLGGLLIGFCGIVMLVWPEIRVGGGRPFLVGVIAAQIACVGWAVGSIFGRRRGHTDARDENVLVTAAYEMLFGVLDRLRRGRRIHGVRLRAEAPAGGDRFALRVCQSGDRRDSGNADLEGAVQRANGRCGSDRSGRDRSRTKIVVRIEACGLRID
jgi:EamA-like transporter family protein